MPFEFAQPLPERRFKDLKEALSYLDDQPVKDRTVEASAFQFTSPTEIKLSDRKTYQLSQSAYVQLLHFAGMQWQDVKDSDPADATEAIRDGLSRRQGDLVVRTKNRTVQAVVSPGYTPVSNADVLRGATAAMGMDDLCVTVFRGYLRITGTTPSIKFEPQVGDILSGGFEVFNNEFGKGVLGVQRFLLRLICSNGAVVRDFGADQRIVHRGRERDALVHHLSELGSDAATRMRGLDEALREMADTRLGERLHNDLLRTAAAPLGRKGMDAFREAVTPASSVYDAYNHLTWVSQEKGLGPRRELEVIAGSLLGT